MQYVFVLFVAFGCFHGEKQKAPETSYYVLTLGDDGLDSLLVSRENPADFGHLLEVIDQLNSNLQKGDSGTFIVGNDSCSFYVDNSLAYEADSVIAKYFLVDIGKGAFNGYSGIYHNRYGVVELKLFEGTLIFRMHSHSKRQVDSEIDAIGTQLRQRWALDSLDKE